MSTHLPDILISSKELKVYVAQRLDQNEIDINKFCERYEVPVDSFRNKYLANEESMSIPEMRQQKFISMLEALGIGVTLKISLRPNVPDETIRACGKGGLEGTSGADVQQGEGPEGDGHSDGEEYDAEGLFHEPGDDQPHTSDSPGTAFY